MPSRYFSTEGLVLGISESGENFLHYLLLSPQKGILNGMKRRSRKTSPKAPPDLFDQAYLELEQSKKGSTWFLKDYELIHRHSNLAGHYRAFSCASDYARFLSKNLAHFESFYSVYEMSLVCLRCWENGKRPETVYFKALFRLVRDEGFPVQEDWLNSRNSDQAESISNVLNATIDEQTSSPDTVEKHLKSLVSWIREETDFVI